MPDLHEHFSTEQLLYDNPVYLERSPAKTQRDFYPSYAIRLKSDTSSIGKTKVVFLPARKLLLWPTLEPDLRDEGYGTALYVAASELSGPDGRNLPLYSDYQRYLSDGSRHVWGSLARRGLAEAPTWHNGRFRYMGQTALEHVIDETHNSVIRGSNLDSAEL